MTRNEFLRIAGIGVLILAIGSLASIAVEYVFTRRNASQPLVVMARDNVELKTGNGNAYPMRENVPPLRGGVEARLLSRREDRHGVVWVQIQLSSEEVGWVRRDQVLVDE